MSANFLLKLRTEEGEEFYAISSWSDDGCMKLKFELREKAFSSEITDSEFLEMEESLKQGQVDPLLVCSYKNSAFMEEDENSKMMVFNLDESNEYLSWKMKMTGVNFIRLLKFKVYEVKLKEAHEEILQACYEKFKFLQDKTKYTNQLEEKFKDYKAKNEKLIEDLKQEKEEMEANLYKKFVCVLNTKKRKLRDFKEEASLYRPSGSSIKKREVKSEDEYAGDTDADENDVDYDTDEERKNILDQKPVKNIHKENSFSEFD